MTNINTFQGDVFIHEYIKHIGDDNNLFGFSGTDTFKIATAGADAMTVQSNGNVGIGTATSDNRLHIYNNADNVGYVMENNARTYTMGIRGDTSDVFAITDDTAGAFRMTVQSNGNVGIGTATSDSRLHIYNNSDNIAYVIENNARTYSMGIRGDTSDVFAITDDTAAAFRLCIAPSGNVGIKNADCVHTFDVGGDSRATGNLSQGGNTNSRPIITRKVATIVNNYPSCDFYLPSLSGGFSPFFIDAIGYSVNVSGTLSPTLRRRISMHSLTNNSSSLVNGPAWTFSGGISVSFTNSTRRVRVQLTDLRSYSGIRVELKSFSGVTA